MKTTTLIFLISMLFNFGCKKIEPKFPDRKAVLVSEFSSYENFFPIITLDLTGKGIKDKIHVIYVSFDPSTDSKKNFPENENVDAFTYSIEKDGLYRPLFDKGALIIGHDFEKYFVEGKAKYQRAKSDNIDFQFIVEYPENPEWWQDDETPKDSKGENCKFICQVEVIELNNDDCRMYIFYDQTARQVKCIYQRT